MERALSWLSCCRRLQEVAGAVVACWRRGDLGGLELPLDSGEEARALTRPAMTLARAEVRVRLARRVARARRRRPHPTSGHRIDEPFR